MLRFGKYEIFSANFGEDSALPDIHNNTYIRAAITLTDNITQEERKYIGKGMITTLLPYKVQNGYDRSRTLKGFDAAILENEFLRAVFIPELGGRLWSLYDKKNSRELLYKNDVFQPANLALRNAWFSGGVEWNVGIKGHNPLTCSPLFAQRVFNENGDELLKMYEFERIRGVTYVIYALLKEDVLLVKVCIENTKDEEVPMYWWSNIAVPETADTRTIVPARETFFCGYEDGGYVLDCAKLPDLNGVDITYAVNSNRSRDFFFKIPENEDKWIAAIDGKGKGLLQFSTDELAGRKMFVWGQGRGGKHWNEWLSDSGKPYIEIQAGILKTQLEHFPMQANSEISFVEGYCMAHVDAQRVHGGDYGEASDEVARFVKKKKEFLNEDVFRIIEEESEIYFGSGWGALENMIRSKPISKYCRFPKESIGKEQEPWLALVRDQALPVPDEKATLTSFVVGEYWRDKIEKSLRGNWFEWLHLGILRYASGDYRGAKECCKKSVEAKDNAWAHRNLAQIVGNIYGDVKTAANEMEKAADLLGEYVPILVETATALMRVGEFKKWIERYRNLGKTLQNVGRLKMLTGACFVELDRIDEAKEFINENIVVDDIMEGEYSLSGIWTKLYAKVLAKEENTRIENITKTKVLEKYPLPYALDFRMH